MQMKVAELYSQFKMADRNILLKFTQKGNKKSHRLQILRYFIILKSKALLCIQNPFQACNDPIY